MKHKSTHSGFLLLLCLLSTASLRAQDSSRAISLQQAIDLSIAHSALLKNYTARIAEATAVVDEARERQLPDAGVSGTYLRLPFQPNISLANNSGNAGPKVTQVLYGTFEVSMPLYAGGKIKYGMESARYLAQAAKLDAAVNKDAVIFNTVNAYSNLYKAFATVALIKENLAQSHQREKDFTNLEKNGLVARNDLLKVSLQSSNIELALLDAQSNYQLASVNMALLLGLDMPEHTTLIAVGTDLALADSAKTLAAYEQLAMQNRQDIAAIGLRKKVADIGTKMTKADYYPSVALTAGYIAADIPNFLTITNAVNIGLGVKYSLSSFWKTTSKMVQTEAKTQQLVATQAMLTDQVKLQTNQSYEAYLLSRKKIEVYQKSVAQAAENYRIVKNKYDNALATTTDLLEADVAQLQTQLNVAGATADAVVAYYKLLQTTGLLNN